jgi:hypothetical protein
MRADDSDESTAASSLLLNAVILTHFAMKSVLVVTISISNYGVHYYERDSYTRALWKSAHWKAVSCSFTQQRSCLLWNTKVHSQVLKSPPLTYILSKMHTEELHKIHSSLKAIREIKSKRMRQVCTYQVWKRREMHSDNLNGRNHIDLRLSGKIILKWVLKYEYETSKETWLPTNLTVFAVEKYFPWQNLVDLQTNKKRVLEIKCSTPF